MLSTLRNLNFKKLIKLLDFHLKMFQFRNWFQNYHYYEFWIWNSSIKCSKKSANRTSFCNSKGYSNFQSSLARISVRKDLSGSHVTFLIFLKGWMAKVPRSNDRIIWWKLGKRISIVNRRRSTRKAFLSRYIRRGIGKTGRNMVYNGFKWLKVSIRRYFGIKYGCYRV